jgi:hypothetical protein
MNEPVTGPIIIACAAYTLAQSTPLYELTTGGYILINLTLSAVAFLLIGGIWYSNPGKKVAVERVRILSTLLVAAAVVMIGVTLVRHTRVAWDGFLIVLVALALHRRFESLVAWLRAALPKAIGVG